VPVPCTTSLLLGPPSGAACTSQQSDPSQPRQPAKPGPVQPNQTPTSSQTQPQPQPFGLPFPSSSLPARPQPARPASQTRQPNQGPSSQTRPLPAVRPSHSRSLLGCRFLPARSQPDPSQTPASQTRQPAPPAQPGPAQPNQTPTSSQTQPQPQPFGLPCSRPQPFGLPCNHPQPFGLPWYPASQAWKEEPLRPGRASCFSILITRVKRKTLARGTKPQKPERITSFRLESSS
jgi:hypothetical protein